MILTLFIGTKFSVHEFASLSKRDEEEQQQARKSVVYQRQGLTSWS